MIPKVCGNKASNLFKLKQNGIRVPDGFLITSDALKKTFKLDHADFQNIEPSKEELKNIRHEIFNRDIKETQLISDIEKQLNRINIRNRNKSLIARSSGGAEDGDSLSFAGIFESVTIGFHIDSLIEGVKEVYSSAYADKAVSYARFFKAKKNLPIPYIQDMSILVQKLIGGTDIIGGVVFTKDPLGGKYGRVEISSCGPKSVVDGKDIQISGSFALDQGIISKDDLSKLSDLCNSEYQSQLLSKSLSEIVTKVQSLFTTNQDIEWIWDGGNIWILQTRSITEGVKK